MKQKNHKNKSKSPDFGKILLALVFWAIISLIIDISFEEFTRIKGFLILFNFIFWLYYLKTGYFFGQRTLKKLVSKFNNEEA